MPLAPEPTTLRENLRIVFPLFFVGAACFVLSLLLFQAAGSIHPSRVPLWLLSLSIGVVATVGASTALVLGDFSEPTEGLGEAALRSGEYVMVPRAEWEHAREGLRSPPSPLARPESDLWSPTSSVGFLEPSLPSERLVPTGASGAESPPSEGPLWQESIFTAADVRRAGRVSRATDRLAEQVDELVRELDVGIAPPSPSAGTRSEPQRRAARPPAGDSRKGRAPLSAEARASEQARQEYETLLHELQVEAERAVEIPAKPRDLVCSSCARSMGVDEPWEACTRCWRTYCPECLRTIHPHGRDFVCPQCGHRR